MNGVVMTQRHWRITGQPLKTQEARPAEISLGSHPCQNPNFSMSDLLE